MKFTLLSFFLLINSFLFAQDGKSTTAASLHITGLVIDSTTNKPVPGATVEAISSNTLTPYKGNAISDFNGRFTIKNIPVLKNVQLTVTAIGYGTQIIHTSLSKPDFSAASKDIGTIILPQQTNTLGNVVVTATAAPAMQFGIDRKIFNVEKNITAQGGTAVDVMKNIPSLSVDVDGNVEMRNSSPQILIDGRPTILTLDQIPADDIERVELITNPSAKYDASSSGGIINIVMKKNKRVGLNGIASIGAGSPSVLTGN
jgi:outer membrane receptor protein involved in Fe transport